jgi:D-glycero-D-manno-heptose 1,7-bisphosphate phosphatase
MTLSIVAPRPAAAAVPAGSARAVFIDKDGTLVKDVPYNVDPGMLRFTHRALSGLRALAEAGFALIVVTNQAGLATGRFTRQQFASLESALKRRVRDEGGVDITALYCCPHAAGEGGRPACLCRKPAPGMLRRAAVEHRLDLARCWLVGDILDDVEAAHRAGCRAVLLDVGNETEWKLSPIRRPDARCADLGEAAEFILRAEPQADAPARHADKA